MNKFNSFSLRNFIRCFQLLFFLGLLSFISCKTYFIPIDSFKNQFVKIDSIDLKEVQVQGPLGTRYSYLKNNIQIIDCIDKKGNLRKLKSNPSIETRITYGQNNKKIIYYFDRLFVTDTSVIGVQSRFFPLIRKSILLSSITKIEIQDGKKAFRYLY